MFLGSGMIWRRLLSFLGRHLEPSVPPVVTETLTSVILFNHTRVNKRVWVWLSLPVCDADPYGVEEKPENIRREARGQMMTRLHLWCPCGYRLSLWTTQMLYKFYFCKTFSCFYSQMVAHCKYVCSCCICQVAKWIPVTSWVCVYIYSMYMCIYIYMYSVLVISFCICRQNMITVSIFR